MKYGKNLLGKFIQEKDSTWMYFIFDYRKKKYDDFVRPIGIRIDRLIKDSMIVGFPGIKTEVWSKGLYGILPFKSNSAHRVIKNLFFAENLESQLG
jgi:hypothetical protein